MNDRRRRLARIEAVERAEDGRTPAASTRPRCVVLLPTHERPTMCLRLLEDLATQREAFHHLVVFDDASSSDYSEARAVVAQLGGTWERATKRHGKQRFWCTINRLLEIAREHEATEVVFLADDMRLCRDFFGRVREAWSAIEDPRKAAMNLLVDRGRADVPCWTNLAPQRAHGGVLTGWVDGCFYGSFRFLQVISRIDAIPETRWEGNSHLSSGVWQQVSSRLVGAQWNLYRAPESLVVHVAAPSAMNQRSRLQVPIVTHRFVDGPARARALAFGAGPVVATMASIPSRRLLLRKTVEALLPQVDRLVVYLNYGAAPTPAFLQHPSIRVVRADGSDGAGDLSDMGKFYPSEEVLAAGYCVTVDDDLLYAPDYVDRLLHHIEMRDRRCAVGYHGVLLLEGAAANYYQHRQVFPCRRHVPESRPVHVLGTGALAFATQTVELDRSTPSLMRGRHMADIWFGVAAQRSRTPLQVLAHTGSELEQQATPEGDSIFERMRPRAGAQGDLIRSVWPWRLWERTA
jgi:hypothetical protein